MKICVITCYNQPDYIRALTLRNAVAQTGNELIVVKNTKLGLMRYFEVAIRLIAVRYKFRPDAYILTFRGYEMLLYVRLISFGKFMIYDEFINPIEWVVHEQRQVEAKQKANRAYDFLTTVINKSIVRIVRSWLFKRFYRRLVSSVDFVLADTNSHADISANITGIPRNKIMSVYVGTDETLFNTAEVKRNKHQDFTVFYYGNMLPLHGLEYVIKAAKLLINHHVRFVIVGGNAAAKSLVNAAIADGASIDYRSWVPFTELPQLIADSDVCLAGPFGNTFQSQYVITGKAYQFLAMSKPIILGENKESHIFTNKKNALVLQQASAESISQAVMWAVEHRSELDKIGKNARLLYEKCLSQDTVSAQLEHVLTKLSAK